MSDLPSRQDDWAIAARALYMAGSWEAADADCEFVAQGDDPCDPQEPECEPCEQRAALMLYEAAEEDNHVPS